MIKFIERIANAHEHDMETRSPVSRAAAYTSFAISPAVRLRTRPPCVEAQKRQPMRQPTCVDTHTVLP